MGQAVVRHAIGGIDDPIVAIGTIWFGFKHGDLSVFETNIRFIGGLLSTYALTSDPVFLTKARLELIYVWG